MSEHGPGQKEGHVGLHVEPREQLVHGRQAAGVLFGAQAARQEAAKLDQGVLALQRHRTALSVAGRPTTPGRLFAPEPISRHKFLQTNPGIAVKRLE